MSTLADSKKRKKVMVIEDNEDIATVLKRRLQVEGYDVLSLANGLDVLTALQDEGEPAAIILDLMIPNRSGLELLSPIQAKWKNTKVFIFSAHKDFERMIPTGTTEGFFLKTGGVDRLIAAIGKSLK